MPFLNPLYIIAVLIAIAIHECSHAVAAYWLGDDTAKWEGRMTLNPLSHLDLFGALLFLTVGFGWAKPVPVNPVNLKHPKRDMAIVALAGPVSNLLLAFACYAGLHLLGSNPSSFEQMTDELVQPSVGQAMLTMLLTASLMVNLGLMAFNLLPVPPLDGSNILRMFIPYRFEWQYAEWMQRAPMILLGVLLLEAFTHVRILSGFVGAIIGATVTVFQAILPI